MSSKRFSAASLIAVTDNKSHLTLTRLRQNASELSKQQLPHYLARSLRLFIPTMCNTRLRFKYIFCYFYFSRDVWSTSIGKQTHSARQTEQKTFVFSSPHSCVAFWYSGVSTIRASTKPILEKLFWRTNETENWLTKDIYELFFQWAFIPTCAPLC